MGPIIFLRLAEKQVGDYDGMFYPRYYGGEADFDDFEDRGYYLNY